MPKFDSKATQPVFELLNGDYPFQIIAVDNGISQGAKTRGSETREVKLKFYTDTTFTKPMAQWTEDFINWEDPKDPTKGCLWKWSLFARCVGFVLTEGDEFDITEAWVGMRGWATCKPKASQTDKDKKYNEVVVFITNKEKLTRAEVAAKPAEDDDIPF